MPITPYADLDVALSVVSERVQEVLGDTLVGAYVEGSFALGAGDRDSDVDVIVVLRSPLTARQERLIREFQRQFPTRTDHWALNLEGSYALLDDLRDPHGVGRPWLFVDRGHSELAWDSHGNDYVHRWVLREHGLIPVGAPPKDVVAPVLASDLQAEARRDLPGLRHGLLGWLDLDVAASLAFAEYAEQWACDHPPGGSGSDGWSVG